MFTGALARRSRDEAGAEVARHGGKISGSVSKLTDFVVVGTDPGSKRDKARSLGVTILSEDDFDKLLAGKLPLSPRQTDSPDAPPKAKRKAGAKIDSNGSKPRRGKSKQQKAPERTLF